MKKNTRFKVANSMNPSTSATLIGSITLNRVAHRLSEASDGMPHTLPPASSAVIFDCEPFTDMAVSAVLNMLQQSASTAA